MNSVNAYLSKSYPVACDDVEELVKADMDAVQKIDETLKSLSQDSSKCSTRDGEILQVYHTALLHAQKALKQRAFQSATCFSHLLRQITVYEIETKKLKENSAGKQ